MHRWLFNPDPDVRAVFHVPNSPGRIYVEAASEERAVRLLKNSVFTYCRPGQTYAVDPAEFTVLLSPIREPGVDVHSWVTIRGGRYHRDIGQVRAVREHGGLLDVAVVPRIAASVGSKPKAAKRARVRDPRPPPRRMRWEDAVFEFGNKAITRRDSGYEHKSCFYEEDGFRILTIGRDSVELARPTLRQISKFVDAAVERVINTRDASTEYTDDDVWAAGHIDLKKLDFDHLLKIGDEVEIVDGSRRGLTGVVTGIGKDGRIKIVSSPTDSLVPSPVEFEESVELVRAVFKKGQSVNVRTGTFAGRTGIVESVDGGNLIIRESRTLNEVSVVYAYQFSDLTSSCSFWYPLSSLKSRRRKLRFIRMFLR